MAELEEKEISAADRDSLLKRIEEQLQQLEAERKRLEAELNRLQAGDDVHVASPRKEELLEGTDEALAHARENLALLKGRSA